MLKRIANLPFAVLGRVARAVQERELERQQARNAREGASEERSGARNIPGFDVPDDYDAGRMERSPASVLGWVREARPFTLVDVRGSRSAAIPGSEHLPMATLGIDLAELPPAGEPVVVYCDDGRISRQAVRFLRFRGIDDAVLLLGGLQAWKAAGGAVEPVQESP